MAIFGIFYQLYLIVFLKILNLENVILAQNLQKTVFAKNTKSAKNLHRYLIFGNFLPAGSEKTAGPWENANLIKKCNGDTSKIRQSQWIRVGTWRPIEILFQNRTPLLRFGFLNLFQNDTRSFSLKDWKRKFSHFFCPMNFFLPMWIFFRHASAITFHWGKIHSWD